MFKDKKFMLCSLGLLLLVLISYSNHFHNSFHFDDSHCIENNGYIRSLHNIPLFFKSGETFSALPSNQTYRPVLSVVYAIAYHLGSGNVFWFHFIIFGFFLGLGILIFLLALKIFETTLPNLNNKYFALFASGWFMLSTCNSDTINYISSSSDSISTFWVLVALVLFIYYPAKRKFCYYLIPLIIASLVKPSAIVFPLLLGLYALLFENTNISPISFSLIKKIFILIVPSLVLSILLYILQAKLNSPHWHPSASRYHYIITQPFVTLYYLFTFYFPFGLSVDPDWAALKTIFDWHFFAGLLFFAVFVRLVIYSFKRPKSYPILFGLGWYLIALLPSALIPLEEVMNDHRAFFSNIGLAIASVWVFRFALEKLPVNSAFVTGLFKVVAVLILILNSVGTFERNKVWKTEETLWHDVTVKSPNNGRGLMNYGNVLMSQGKFNETELYYKKALELCPYYSYLYENMGILKAAEKQIDTAEMYFNKALALSPNEPSVYFFYARFLHQQNQNDRAIGFLKQSLALSPSNVDARYLLMETYLDQEDWLALADLAQETLNLFPGDAKAEMFLQSSIARKSKLAEAANYARLHPTVDNYINLSLLYFNHKYYDSCIIASEQVLKLDPSNSAAYNNIGSAYNSLQDWDKAEIAFNQALTIDPGFQLAINNLAWCMKQKNMRESLDSTAAIANTPEVFVNLSLSYYNLGEYQKTIKMCKKAIELKPDFALAYNNMCSAFNMLKMWDDAITAGEKAVELDPNNQLAKNNLAVALKAKGITSK